MNNEIYEIVRRANRIDGKLGLTSRITDDSANFCKVVLTEKDFILRISLEAIQDQKNGQLENHRVEEIVKNARKR